MKRAPPRVGEELTARLKKAGAPPWPILRKIEASLGGLSGRAPDERELVIGSATRRFGEKAKVAGAPYAIAGFFDPLTWLVDREGRIVERDEHGVAFFSSDSLEKRLEQIAIGDPWEGRPGRHGAALAKKLALPAIAAPSDSRQRYWGTGGAAHVPGKGLLVCERFAPSDYGKTDLVWTTWVWAATPTALRRALGSIPKSRS